MKLKHFKHLFTALLLLCTTVASAHDFEVGGIYYKILSAVDKTVEVTYKGTSYSHYSNEYTGSVVIPETVTYNETIYTVISIGDYAFSYCYELTSVVIGNGVTSIGYEAFYHCDGLTRIVIPNSVTSIGGSAFWNCTSLKTVVNFSNLTFSMGTTSHGYIACYANKVFNAPNVFIDGDYIWLENEDGMTLATYWGDATELILPTEFNGKSVTSIGEFAFENCTSLTSIEIPNSVKSIGCGAFNGTAWYENQPEGLVYAGKVLYDYKGAMPSNTSITIKDGTLGISGYAFSSCSGLTSVVIPNSVTNIGRSAFYSCSGLTSIEIPNSVTSIGDKAFNGCSGLKDIHISDIAAWCNISFDDFYANPLYYAKNLYLNGEKVTSLVIPDEVTEILPYTFYKCTSLTDVTIPNSVTSIGNSAFYNCSGLTSITIPNSLTSIGIGVFYGCSGLKSVEIPNSVTSIGNYAFSSCSGLTSVEIPNSVTSIGVLAFGYCQRLTSITIPNSVTSIREQAFYYCSKLASVTSLIPADELFAIDSYAFYNACTLYVPYGAKETYAATEGWSEFANIVELEPTATEVTVTINQYGSATYCSPFALDFSEVEGMKAYVATGYKTNSQVVTLTRVQTAEAGIGLFLKGEPGEYVVPVIESTDEHSLNMLVGTLEPTTVNSTAGEMSNYKFTIADGDAAPMFYPFEDNTTFSAGKAYLQIPTAWLPATAQKSLNIRFDDGETTDVDELKGENGEVKTIYDMQGRVVENPTSGIYIIDGKKVLVK